MKNFLKIYLPSKNLRSIAGTVAADLARKLLPALVRKIPTLMRATPGFKHKAKALNIKKPFNVNLFNASDIYTFMARGGFSAVGAINLLLNIGDILKEYTRKTSSANLTEALSLNINSVWVFKDRKNTDTLQRT